MGLLDYFQDKHILITGGCGFIGSHIVDQLINLQVAKITVIDDLSAGTSDIYLQPHNEITQLIKKDIRSEELYNDLNDSYDILIHLAAQPSVPYSVKEPYIDFQINVNGTMKLLEFARKNGIDEFVFAASGGTVYGEVDQLPTPEFYPLRPISNYGASKAAVEMYLKAYSGLYDMKTTSMRFGNVFGPRSQHGVMYDFYHKLKKNPKELLILGNGKQEKSYLYIDDCVSGFFFATSRDGSGFLPINMAASPTVTVNRVADYVSEAMDLTPEYQYTGGERGWKGDVKRGELDTTLLKSLGWKQKTNIKYGVDNYIRWLESQ